MSDISQLSKLKDVLTQQILNLPDDVSLCLSAGIDSIALLSMLLQCNKSVTVYSFTLKSKLSNDFNVAKKLADKYNLRFVDVLLPDDEMSLKRDVLVLHNEFGCRKKTDYECVWPFLYVYPKLQNNVIVAGLGAEGNFGTTKRACIHYKNNLDEFRDLFFSNQNVSQTIQHSMLGEKYNIKSWFPFLTDDVRNIFIGKSWEELNQPHVKNCVFELIPNDIRKFVRTGNLQLDSGIAKHFDMLLNTDWNLHNYKSIIGIFNSIERGEIVSEYHKGKLF